MMRDHDCPDLLYEFTKQNFSQYIADVLMRKHTSGLRFLVQGDRGIAK